MSIEFRDLKRQYAEIKESIDLAIQSAIESAHFISGPEVKELEKKLADYVGRKYCISCANGTDAITIALKAAGIGAGDAVFVPDFTFFSSGECPATVGATPVFVDVRTDTYNMDVDSFERAVDKVVKEGKLTPKAVVAVDLFGQPFDYEAIKAVCEKHGMLLLEDAAQGFGGEYTLSDGTKYMAGKLGDISTTSFFPAKPLGCYGDGGAIFTDDDHIADMCRSIAVHGKDTENPDDTNAKYNNIRLGYNSRLDTIQAAVLLAKFDTFKNFELEKINHVAELYTSLLKEIPGIKVPVIADNCFSSWAQYTIRLPEDVNRAELQKKLKEEGIPTNIYYIKPMHKQGAFIGTRSAEAECPNTEMLCERVLCLPIHPYMLDEEIYIILRSIKNFSYS